MTQGGGVRMNAKKGRMSKGFRLFSAIVALSMLCALLLLVGTAAADDGAPSVEPGAVDCYWGGVKFKDLDADGRNRETGEPLLSGWTIKLKMEASPFTEYTVVTQSGSDLGKWQFPDGLSTYKVYLISEVLQSGWKQTYPNTNGGVYRIKYQGSGSYELLSPQPTGYSYGSLNFGNAPLGSIGDYVWHDQDRNGQQNEPVATHALANVDVRLWLKGNGQLIYKGVQTTDANGYYLFTGLSAGTYLVDCDQGDVTFGWTLTTNNDPLTVTLATGENRRDADFGYAGIPNGQVALGDWIWYDINLDGLQNDGAPSEVGLQCITVWLYQGSNYMGMTSTDTYGWYVFQGLPAGTYSVKVDTADPDWGQVLNYNSATKPCTPPTAPASLAAAAFQPDDVPIITTATELTYNVPSGYEPRYDFAAGSSPTAVSLQGFGATPLPLVSIEVAVAAVGTLIAGALALKRRR
jgi:hypothetical protein